MTDCNDISVRRRPPALAIEQWAIRLGGLIEASAEAVFLKDREGRYLLANRAAARLLGRSPGEIVGRTDAELLPPETAAAVLETECRILASGETVTLAEAGIVDGRTHSWQSTRGVFRDMEGNVTGLFGIVRDRAGSGEIERELARLAVLVETPHEAMLMLRPSSLHAAAALLQQRRDAQREQVL